LRSKRGRNIRICVRGSVSQYSEGGLILYLSDDQENCFPPDIEYSLSATMTAPWHLTSNMQRAFITCFRRPVGAVNLLQQRLVSTDSSLGQSSVNVSRASQPSGQGNIPSFPPLAVMPTRILIRSIMMTYILSSPRLVSFSVPIMNKISHSKFWLFSPDKNPVLHLTVRKLVYDHFCAGENEEEIKITIANFKKMGFEGVILGYAKETLVDKSASAEEAAKSGETGPIEKVVEEWKHGTLRTLGMLGKRDFLAVK
jgi:hypothetical protein